MSEFSPIDLKSSQQRILLGQLVSNGDCLYATAIARQIKIDYPNCHLTWGISQRCRTILDGNPYIDEVWAFSPSDEGDWPDEWDEFEAKALERKRRGEFDEVFLTQIAPANLHNYISSTRASIFRAYPRPITVPVAPVLRLSDAEIQKADEFARQHNLADKKNVVLFECSPQSKQSKVTPDFALEFARKFVAEHPDAVVILSSNVSFASLEDGILDGSVLSLRETMGIIAHCTLLIGCSSGITWASTSEGLKSLPMIQLLVPDLIRSNSVVHDYQSRNISTEGIVEMTRCSIDKLINCVDSLWDEGFAATCRNFHQQIPFKYDLYRGIQFQLLKKREYAKARLHLKRHLEEFGNRPRFFLESGIMVLKCYLPWPFALAARLRDIQR